VQNGKGLSNEPVGHSVVLSLHGAARLRGTGSQHNGTFGLGFGSHWHIGLKLSAIRKPKVPTRTEWKCARPKPRVPVEPESKFSASSVSEQDPGGNCMVDKSVNATMRVERC
jgi:hypothetical protein